MGRLFEQEYVVISELMEQPQHPCVFVLGGAKVSDAFLMMDRVLSSGAADQVLTGGLVANIMLAAKGEPIGQGSMDFIKKSNLEEMIAIAGQILSKHADKIILPKTLAYLQDGERREDAPANLPTDASVLDIGEVAAREYARIIQVAKTVFVNGPMGVFEQPATELGTKIVWDALGDTPAYTVVGGGDSITATSKYGKTDKISYICTGGGALIRFLTGEELPVVKALRYAAKTFGRGQP